jgi:hypothetical protein
MRCISSHKGIKIMVHGILSTLSVAALGLFAARATEIFRIPLTRRPGCDDPQSKGSAWSYKSDAVQPERTWLRVTRHGTC